MRLFKDIMSGTCLDEMDEAFSDARPILDVPDVPGLVKTPLKMIVVSDSIDDRMIGGNASAEGEDAGDAACDEVRKEIDVVHTHQLKELGGFHYVGDSKDQSKKAITKIQLADFMSNYFKGYIKALGNRLSQEDGFDMEEYKSELKTVFAFIKKNWDNIAFYGSEKCPDNVAALDNRSISFLTYGEDGLPDFMYYIKRAYLPEKC